MFGGGGVGCLVGLVGRGGVGHGWCWFVMVVVGGWWWLVVVGGGAWWWWVVVTPISTMELKRAQPCE